jgi:hypothetical protein
MIKSLFVCLVSIFFLNKKLFAQDDSLQLPNRIDTVLQSNFVDSSKRDSTIVEEKIISKEEEKDRATNLASKNEAVYKINPAVDIPIGAIGSGWSLYAFTKIYNKSHPTEEEILSLNKNDINGFDRWAVRTYSSSLDKISYYPFYASMPLPFIVMLADEKMREDFWKLSFLYWETMSVTGLFGTGGTYFFDRYRPYAYDENTPLEKRTSRNAKNSFYAGHVQIAATPAFFIAKVYSDYYPDSKAKWLFYAFAAGSTSAMSYMRLQGGLHFPSDLALGISMGVLAGVLIPDLHKSKKNSDLSVLPYRNGNAQGLTFIYRTGTERKKDNYW